MDRKSELAAAWDRNAENWARAVRDGLIASRKAGSDEAIVSAIVARRPARLLDVGCGEGWLIRRVCALTGCEAVGIDGTASLIERASEADPRNHYLVLSYDALIAGAPDLGGAFDIVAFNYALFDQESAKLLAAVRPLMAAAGRVVIQTLHPCCLPPGQPYRDGWRTEDFAGFEGQDWQPMPWYFRTLESWHRVVRDAGLVLHELREPLDEATGRPLSLLMVCGAEA